MGKIVDQRKPRSQYTGAYAQAPWSIRISNNSTPVENRVILDAARESCDDFYRDTMETINEICQNIPR